MIDQRKPARRAHSPMQHPRNKRTHVPTSTNPYFVPAGRDYDTQDFAPQSAIKSVMREPVTWIGSLARKFSYAIRRARMRVK